MGDINLLPQELKPSRAILKISEKLKALALISVIFFMISVAVYFSAIYFLSYRITSTLEEQDSLENQIKALEKTEQRLVLIKDRLTKINSASTKPQAKDELERLKMVSDYFPQNTKLVEAELIKNSLSVTVLSENLDGVANYLASIVASGEFLRVNLLYLGFNPENGYAIKLAFPE